MTTAPISPVDKFKSILVILAHQDDEFCIATRLQSDASTGHMVTVLYLTDGGGKGVPAKRRDAESRKVLRRLGISNDRIHFIGSDRGFRDGSLVQYLEACGAEILTRLENQKFHKIYCPAWEGGHADHDASHLLALSLSQSMGLLPETWEFSLYNGHRRGLLPFRVMNPILLPLNSCQSRRITLYEGIRTLALLRFYRSQWKTFLGLFPEAFIKLVIKRQEIVQLVQPLRVLETPHAGPLLYERMFHVSHIEFMEYTSTLRHKICQSLGV